MWKFLYPFFCCTVLVSLGLTDNPALSSGSLAQHKDKEVALVATLNGTVFAVDVDTGATQWEISLGGQMVRSSMPMGGGSQSLFVPTINGDLFMYDPNSKMQKLPFSAQDLVDAAPFVTNDGTVFLGSKRTHIYCLDPSSGDMNKWQSDEGDEHDDGEQCGGELPPRGTLLIGRTEYYVKALDSRTGLPKWNMSLAELHTTLSPVDRGLLGPQQPESEALSESQAVSVSHYPAAPAWSEKYAFRSDPSGMVYCVDSKSGNVKWKARFESQMVSVHVVSDSISSASEYAHPFHLAESGLAAAGAADQNHVRVGVFGDQLIATTSIEHGLVVETVEDNDPHSTSLTQYPSSWRGLVGVHEVEAIDTGLIHQLPPSTTRPPLAIYPSTASLTPSPNPAAISRSGKGVQFELSYGMMGTVLAGFVGFTGTILYLVVSTLRRAAPHPQFSADAVAHTVPGAGADPTGVDTSDVVSGSVKFDAHATSTSSDVSPEKRSEAVVPPDDGVDDDEENEDASVALSKYNLDNTPEAANPGGTRSDKSEITFTEGTISDGQLMVGKLRISQTILGYGSQGTIVFEGQLEDGRVVAVKRMLKQFYDVANKEVELLVESDEQSNIIRYYAKEQTNEFIFLALELCDRTLTDVLEAPAAVKRKTADELASASAPPGFEGPGAGRWAPKTSGPGVLRSKLPFVTIQRYCRELLTGLLHLHDLSIVHRDLKPRNVLLTKRDMVKISDMGLARKLEGHRESFSTVGSGAGSFGWLAPEILHGGRMTKAVDIFSAGCLVFYIITGGEHPFGSQYEREMHILSGDAPNTEQLAGFPEARDLVESMVCNDADRRLTVQQALRHPFFWSPGKQLQFLNDASDRLECEKPTVPIVTQLEARSHIVVGRSWQDALHPDLIGNLGKYRKYNFQAIRDLLRVIRNKKNHFRDLPQHVQDLVGQPPDFFLQYFVLRFPLLLMETYRHLHRFCLHDSVFGEYF